MRMKTSSLFVLPVILVGLTLLLSSTDVVVSAKDDDDDDTINKPNDYGIFDWIHNSPGGYVNPKQEFQYIEGTNIPGMFATENIRKGEVLVKIPWSHVLKPDEGDSKTKGEQMACSTVATVIREMKLDSESDYAPYVQYLNAQSSNQLPSAWSLPAQNLLRQVVGGLSVYKPEIPPAEPTEWLQDDWFDVCDEASRDDELGQKAALLVVQRSDDNIMIPAYDMYNHRNGKYYMNTSTKIKRGQYHITKAKRDIKAGEEIYISYNHCDECGGRNTNYGTGGKYFSDGFVDFVLCG